LYKFDGKNVKTLQKILIVNIVMLMETYYDHGTLMSTNKNKQPMVVKHSKELLTKGDHTTKIIIFEMVKNMI
jgi:hypothetical protein